MKPIQELAAQTCMELEGIAFDVDDTLTYEGKLQSESLDALWRLHGAGLKLMAVTGRPLGWAELFLRQWPIDVAVGENGAGWFWLAEGRCMRGFWDTEAKRKAHWKNLELIVNQLKANLPHLRTTQDQPLRAAEVAYDVAEYEQVSLVDRTQIEHVAQTFGARTVASSIHLHITFGTYDKAQGTIRAALEGLGVDLPAHKERWLYVGDSTNDAPAFAWFPLSAAVANIDRVVHALPTLPTYVARASHGHGFAEIAHHILTCRATT